MLLTKTNNGRNQIIDSLKSMPSVMYGGNVVLDSVWRGGGNVVLDSVWRGGGIRDTI